MGDFRKKISCRLISRRKKLARKYLGKIIFCTEKKISLMTYNAEKEILHRYMSGKKILTELNHPYPLPHKSLMVNHLGGGRRNGLDTSVYVIHQQMAGARSSCGGFQDQSFAFQD